MIECKQQKTEQQGGQAKQRRRHPAPTGERQAGQCLLSPGAVVVAGLTRDFEDDVVPEHLTRRQQSGGVFWNPSECFSFHTAQWWRRHWHQTSLVEVAVADTLEDGCRYWVQWDRAIMAAGTNHFPSDEEALETDQGRHIGFVRMVARRKEG